MLGDAVTKQSGGQVMHNELLPQPWVGAQSLCLPLQSVPEFEVLAHVLHCK